MDELQTNATFHNHVKMFMITVAFVIDHLGTEKEHKAREKLFKLGARHGKFDNIKHSYFL